MSKLVQLVQEDFGIDESYTNKRWARSLLHDSLVIDKQRDIFFWNSRNIYGNILDYLIKVRGVSIEVAKEICGDWIDTPIAVPYTKEDENLEVITTPELVERFYELGKNYRDYWYDYRGYNERTVDNFRLGFTGDWYTIPVFVDGMFRNFQLRRLNPKRVSVWYKNASILPFNFSVLNYTDWVVITEGPPDAIMLRQYKIPAISQTGGAGYWNDAWYEKLARIKRVFVVYDNDEAGNKGSKRLGKVFGMRAKIFNFWNFDEHYDITNFFKAGNSKDDFINLLETKARYYYDLQ